MYPQRFYGGQQQNWQQARFVQQPMNNQQSKRSLHMGNHQIFGNSSGNRNQMMTAHNFETSQQQRMRFQQIFQQEMCKTYQRMQHNQNFQMNQGLRIQQQKRNNPLMRQMTWQQQRFSSQPMEQMDRNNYKRNSMLANTPRSRCSPYRLNRFNNYCKGNPKTGSEVNKDGNSFLCESSNQNTTFENKFVQHNSVNRTNLVDIKPREQPSNNIPKRSVKTETNRLPVSSLATGQTSKQTEPKLCLEQAFYADKKNENNQIPDGMQNCFKKTGEKSVNLNRSEKNDNSCFPTTSEIGFEDKVTSGIDTNGLERSVYCSKKTTSQFVQDDNKFKEEKNENQMLFKLEKLTIARRSKSPCKSSISVDLTNLIVVDTETDTLNHCDNVCSEVSSCLDSGSLNTDENNQHDIIFRNLKKSNDNSISFSRNEDGIDVDIKKIAEYGASTDSNNLTNNTHIDPDKSSAVKKAFKVDVKSLAQSSSKQRFKIKDYNSKVEKSTEDNTLDAQIINDRIKQASRTNIKDPDIERIPVIHSIDETQTALHELENIRDVPQLDEPDSVEQDKHDSRVTPISDQTYIETQTEETVSNAYGDNVSDLNGRAKCSSEEEINHIVHKIDLIAVANNEKEHYEVVVEDISDDEQIANNDSDKSCLLYFGQLEESRKNDLLVDGTSRSPDRDRNNCQESPGKRYLEEIKVEDISPPLSLDLGSAAGDDMKAAADNESSQQVSDSYQLEISAFQPDCDRDWSTYESEENQTDPLISNMKTGEALDPDLPSMPQNEFSLSENYESQSSEGSFAMHEFGDSDLSCLNVTENTQKEENTRCHLETKCLVGKEESTFSGGDKNDYQEPYSTLKKDENRQTNAIVKDSETEGLDINMATDPERKVGIPESEIVSMDIVSAFDPEPIDNNKLVDSSVPGNIVTPSVRNLDVEKTKRDSKNSRSKEVEQADSIKVHSAIKRCKVQLVRLENKSKETKMNTAEDSVSNYMVDQEKVRDKKNKEQKYQTSQSRAESKSEELETDNDDNENSDGNDDDNDDDDDDYDVNDEEVDDDDSDDEDLFGTTPAFLQSAKTEDDKVMPSTSDSFCTPTQSQDSNKDTAELEEEERLTLRSRFSLDDLLKDKEKSTSDEQRRIEKFHSDSKKDIEDGGFITILDRVEEETSDDLALPEENRQILKQLSCEASQICDDRPGRLVFQTASYCCLFGETLHPTHCGFTVGGGKFIEKHLESLQLAQYEQVLSSNIINIAFEKIQCKDQLMRWLFFLMSIHSDYLIRHGCHRNLMDVLHTQKLKGKQAWSPTVADVLTVFVNYGANIESLYVSQDPVQIEFSQPDYIRPEMTPGNQGYSIDNLLLVLEVIAYSLKKRSGKYTSSELTLLLTALLTASLDTKLESFCAFDAFHICVHTVINQYSETDWSSEKTSICRLIPKISSHHHDRVVLIRLLPYDSRGDYLQRRTSFLMLEDLCSVNEKINDEDLDKLLIQHLYRFVGYMKDMVYTDPYRLSSIISLLDLSVGNNTKLDTSEREQLRTLMDLLKRVSGEVRDNVQVLDRTRVKDMMFRVANRWSLDIQATRGKQSKIFEFVTQKLPRQINVESVQTVQSNGESEDSDSELESEGETEEMPCKMPKLEPYYFSPETKNPVFNKESNKTAEAEPDSLKAVRDLTECLKTATDTGLEVDKCVSDEKESQSEKLDIERSFPTSTAEPTMDYEDDSDLPEL